MKKLLPIIACLSISIPAIAEVSVSDCRIREAIDASDMTAAYLTIINGGTEAIELKSASIDMLSDYIELHNTEMTDGVMKMYPVDTIPLNINEETKLQPSGLHIMIMNLKEHPKAGDSYEIKLKLSDDNILSCDAPVMSLQDIKGDKHMDMKHMDVKH